MASSERWRIPSQALLIALLPAAVLVGSDFLLTEHGWPAFGILDRSGELNPAVAAHAEAAARIRIIAGFLLFAAAAAAATGYFAVLSFSADRFSLGAILGAAGGLVLICGAYFVYESHDQTQELIGQRFVCAAASYPDRVEPVLLDEKGKPIERGSQRPRINEDVPEYCRAGRFIGIRNLIVTERYMLFLAVPAVIFGAILCLAAPLTPPSTRSVAGKKVRARHLQIQVNRLNTVLYLSAFLMVGGLLFLSAFLHYPAFLFTGPRLAAFQQHVGSLVLFYAVSYSLLIAAFYVPVAAMLARECALLKHAGATEAEVSGMLSPAQMLKVGGAIFSPLIAGTLGEIMALPV